MTHSSNDRQVYTPEQWQDIFKEWEQSGLSKTEFCNLKNFTPSTFYNWYNKLQNIDSLPDEHGFQDQEDTT